jgi:hypothetical protein
MTVDVTALRREEVVYRTPEEIINALIDERGVPPILIEHMAEVLMQRKTNQNDEEEAGD